MFVYVLNPDAGLGSLSTTTAAGVLSTNPTTSDAGTAPAPTKVGWMCAACDVRWYDIDPVCWSCDSTEHVNEYGTFASMIAAAQARIATIA